MKKQIQEFLRKEHPDIDFAVSYPPEGLGDYSTNIAFLLARQSLGEGGLAKKTGGNPQKLALSIVEGLRNEFKNQFEKIEIAKNGFINFYLSKKYLLDNLSEVLKFPDIGKSKTVIVEYSQPNIAKVMHVGHLRSTVLGDALANIYEALGYKVIRWNYLGDWGTQFGKLISAYKMWGKEEEVKTNPIETLNDLYVRFHDELKNRPELEEKGREEFKKLEEGDEENRKLWKWFKNESLKEFEKIYRILGVKFDTYTGESSFEKDLKPLVEELRNKGIAKESQGAVIISLDQFNLLPALIQRSDGASLYLTRDIAALKYRIKEYKPEKILYVVGNEQSLHFDQLKAIAKISGLDETEISHIKFGLILGKDKKKLSSREGGAVPIKELIDKAVELSGKAVGISALKYFILKEHRLSDIVFDWDRILNLKGDSGPYLQYTYARLASIKSKAGTISKSKNLESLNKEIDVSLMKKMIKFPEILTLTVENNLTNILTLYLYELCNLINRFYESVPVLKEDDEKIRNARLGLVSLMIQILEKGFNLLGIEAPERI
ncbi:MAG: arginine--tRNA ligase [Patescibacteria group bacterium]